MVLKVEWMKDDKRLRRGDRVDMASEGRTHRLVIEKAGTEDVGKYTAVYDEKLTTSAALAVVSKYQHAESCRPMVTMMSCRWQYNTKFVKRHVAVASEALANRTVKKHRRRRTNVL